jgi:hypothetical protein
MYLAGIESWAGDVIAGLTNSSWRIGHVSADKPQPLGNVTW